MFTLFWNRNRRNIVLYLIFVIILSLLLTQLLIHVTRKQETIKLRKESQELASTHAMYIESFVSETIGRLESLSMMINLRKSSLEHIHDFLVQTHEKDPRFSGFYWVGPKGNILVSSNPLSDNVNLMDRDYFQAAIRTGSTQISSGHHGRVTGRFIVSIATPVFNGNKLSGVLIGSVRMDYLQEFLARMTSQETIILKDNLKQQ